MEVYRGMSDALLAGSPLISITLPHSDSLPKIWPID